MSFEIQSEYMGKSIHNITDNQLSRSIPGTQGFSYFDPSYNTTNKIQIYQLEDGIHQCEHGIEMHHFNNSIELLHMYFFRDDSIVDFILLDDTQLSEDILNKRKYKIDALGSLSNVKQIDNQYTFYAVILYSINNIEQQHVLQDNKLNKLIEQLQEKLILLKTSSVNRIKHVVLSCKNQ